MVQTGGANADFEETSFGLLNCAAYAVGGLAITTAATSVPARAKTVPMFSTPMDRGVTSVSI